MIPISLASIGNNLYFDKIDVKAIISYCKNNNNILYSSSSTNSLDFGITAKN